MAGSGMPSVTVDGAGLRVAVVAAQWHENICEGLLAGAMRALEESGVTSVDTFRVAGCYELPVVCQALGASKEYDALVALGAIIRGGTPHFDYVAKGVSDGLMRVSLDQQMPIGFGVLTCDNEVQARDRSGLSGAHEDKGFEATVAVIHTAHLMRGLTQAS